MCISASRCCMRSQVKHGCLLGTPGAWIFEYPPLTLDVRLSLVRSLMTWEAPHHTHPITTSLTIVEMIIEIIHNTMCTYYARTLKKTTGPFPGVQECRRIVEAGKGSGHAILKCGCNSLILIIKKLVFYKYYNPYTLWQVFLVACLMEFTFFCNQYIFHLAVMPLWTTSINPLHTNFQLCAVR